MNKCQYLTLITGTLPIGAMVVLRATPVHPPVMGPAVDTSPGHYAATLTTTAIMPKWVMAATLGLVMLTGTFVYRNRKNIQ